MAMLLNIMGIVRYRRGLDREGGEVLGDGSVRVGALQSFSIRLDRDIGHSSYLYSSFALCDLIGIFFGAFEA